ncbi:serpin B4-like [Pelobates fuscus]|uniref:serpin B4-like n=1 Tax=Pelobates fuscus TaxID=191477 RepID=UPI002FE4D247
MVHLSNAVASFTLDIYKEIIKKAPGENVFFSPFSVSLAMGMLDLGAKGKTADQIETVMHFKSPGHEHADKGDSSCHRSGKAGDTHKEYKELLTNLNAPQSLYELNVANRLYGQKGYEFVQEFLRSTKEIYQASLETVDFQKSTEEARKEINAWVEKQTNEKIKDLFKQGSLDTSTVLVLASAIYFKGKWRSQFKIEFTNNAPFFVNKNEKKTVRMMSQTGQFQLTDLTAMKCKVLELPYEGDLSMLIILPNEIDGLSEIEPKITDENVTEILKLDGPKITVHVSLPHINIAKTYNFIPLLENLGIVDLFTNHADLSGISTKDALKVSAIVHMAYVEVNEEGTVAAAATGVGVSLTSIPVIPQFNVNHPFMFLIRHIPSNLIFFKGRYISP